MKNIFKPMLFSTPMVQAIEKNIKSQTRRTKGLDEINKEPNGWKVFPPSETEPRFHFTKSEGNSLSGVIIPCPWQIGDILWVRESFSKYHIEPDLYLYKANSIDPQILKWSPSIHMPKKACRYFLKVKSIRVDRLQNISESDCVSEGASDRLKDIDLHLLKDLDWVIPRPFSCHQFGFLALWCRINGCDNWLLNPWIWVIEFERIEKPLDFLD